MCRTMKEEKNGEKFGFPTFKQGGMGLALGPCIRKQYRMCNGSLKLVLVLIFRIGSCQAWSSDC